jgi:hypothetical protein
MDETMASTQESEGRAGEAIEKGNSATGIGEKRGTNIVPAAARRKVTAIGTLLFGGKEAAVGSKEGRATRTKSIGVKNPKTLEAVAALKAQQEADVLKLNSGAASKPNTINGAEGFALFTDDDGQPPRRLSAPTDINK